MTETTIIDWAQGDILGFDFPAHPEALQSGGPEFLTRAFRASGALGADNSVTRITSLDEFMLGGTGVKVLLSVAYELDAPGLSRDLFVKFSRNFQDRVRDSGRYHMPSEVRLAILSRDPKFPISVPKCFYADIQQDTLTGVIITERIPYGRGAIEPHYPNAWIRSCRSRLRITARWSRISRCWREHTNQAGSATLWSTIFRSIWTC